MIRNPCKKIPFSRWSWSWKRSYFRRRCCWQSLLILITRFRGRNGCYDHGWNICKSIPPRTTWKSSLYISCSSTWDVLYSSRLSPEPASISKGNLNKYSFAHQQSGPNVFFGHLRFVEFFCTCLQDWFQAVHCCHWHYLNLKKGPDLSNFRLLTG